MARVIVYAADVDETIARTGSRPGIRWGEPADHQAMLAMGVRETWLMGYLNKGARLAVAEEDGRIVGYNIYVTYSPVRQHDWLTVNLRIGHDYLSFGGFVVPERRGRRLLGDLKGFAARHFAAEGYRRNISVVHSDNRSSLRAHAAIGATPVMSVRRARIGKLSIAAKDGGVPRVLWGTPFVVTV
jgi:RimJ/RimL family protein N-acetyltransferase